MDGISELAKLFSQRGEVGNSSNTGFLRDSGNVLSQLEGRNAAMKAIIEEQSIQRREALRRQRELEKEQRQIEARNRQIRTRAAEIRNRLVEESFPELDADAKAAFIQTPTGQTALAVAARDDLQRITTGNPEYDPLRPLDDEADGGLQAYNLVVNSLEAGAQSNYESPAAYQADRQRARGLLDNQQLDAIPGVLRSAGGFLADAVGGAYQTLADTGSAIGIGGARLLGVDEATIAQRQERARNSSDQLRGAIDSVSGFINNPETLEGVAAQAERDAIDPSASLTDRLLATAGTITSDDVTQGFGSVLGALAPGAAALRGTRGLSAGAQILAGGAAGGATAGLATQGDVLTSLAENNPDSTSGERAAALLGNLGAQTALGASTARLGAFAPAQSQILNAGLNGTGASATRSLLGGRLPGELGAAATEAPGFIRSIANPVGNAAIAAGRLGTVAAGRGAAGAIGEGFEEVAQGAITNIAGGARDRNAILDGSVENFVLGGAIGGPVAGSVGGAQRLGDAGASRRSFPTRVDELSARANGDPNNLPSAVIDNTEGLQERFDTQSRDRRGINDITPQFVNPAAPTTSTSLQQSESRVQQDLVNRRNERAVDSGLLLGDADLQARADIAPSTEVFFDPVSELAGLRAGRDGVTSDPDLEFVGPLQPRGVTSDASLGIGGPVIGGPVVTGPPAPATIPARVVDPIDSAEVLERARANREATLGVPATATGLTREQALDNFNNRGVGQPTVTAGERLDIAQEQVDRDIRNRGSVQPDIVDRELLPDDQFNQLRDADAARAREATLLGDTIAQDGGVLTAAEQVEQDLLGDRAVIGRLAGDEVLTPAEQAAVAAEQERSNLIRGSFRTPGVSDQDFQNLRTGDRRGGQQADALEELRQIGQSTAARDIATGVAQQPLPVGAAALLANANARDRSDRSLQTRANNFIGIDPRDLQATSEAQNVSNLFANEDPARRAQADAERAASQGRTENRRRANQEARDAQAEAERLRAIADGNVVTPEDAARGSESANARARELARIQEAERQAAERAAANRERASARQAAVAQRRQRRLERPQEPPNGDSLAGGAVVQDNAENRYRIVPRGDTFVPQVFDPEANNGDGAFRTVRDPLDVEGTGAAAAFTYDDAVGRIQEHSAFNGGSGDLSINRPGNPDVNENDSTPAGTPVSTGAGDAVLTAGNQIQTVVEGQDTPVTIATNANQEVLDSLVDADFDGDVLISSNVRTGTSALIKRRPTPEVIPEQLSSTRLRDALSANGTDVAFQFPHLNANGNPIKAAKADLHAALATGLIYRTDKDGNVIPTREITVSKGEYVISAPEGQTTDVPLRDFGYFRFNSALAPLQGRLANRHQDTIDKLQRDINLRNRQDGDTQSFDGYDPAQVATDYQSVLEDANGNIHQTVVHIPRATLLELTGINEDADTAIAGGDLANQVNDADNTIPTINIDSTGSVIGHAPTRLMFGTRSAIVPVLIESTVPLDGTTDFPILETQGGVEIDSFIDGNGRQVQDGVIQTEEDIAGEVPQSEARDLLEDARTAGVPISQRDQPTLYEQATDLVRRGFARIEEQIAPGRSGDTDNLIARFFSLGATPAPNPGVPGALNDRDQSIHYTRTRGGTTAFNPALDTELRSFFGLEEGLDVTPEALADALVRTNFGGVGSANAVAVAQGILGDLKSNGRQIVNTRRREQHIESLRNALQDSTVTKPTGLVALQTTLDNVSSKYGIEAPVILSSDYLSALNDSGNASYRAAALSFGIDLNKATANGARGAYSISSNTITLQDSDIATLDSSSDAQPGTPEFNLAAFTAFHEHGHALAEWIDRDMAANNPAEAVRTFRAYLDDMSGRDLRLRPAQITYGEWKADQIASMILRDQAGEADAVSEVAEPTTLIGRIAQAVKDLWNGFRLFYPEGTAPPIEAALEAMRQREATRRIEFDLAAQQSPGTVSNTQLVDAAGNPQKLFRGESVPIGTRRGDDSGQVFNNALGFMFTDDPVLADAYASYRSGQPSDSNRSSRYYADVKQPLVIDANGLAEFDNWSEESLANQSPTVRTVIEQSGNTDLRINQALVDQARRYGYDGIVIRDITQGLSTANQNGTPRAGALETYTDQLRQRYATESELNTYLDSVDPLGESAVRETVLDAWANGLNPDLVPSTDTYVVFDKQDVFNPDGISINDRDTLTEGGEQDTGKKPLSRLTYLGAAGHAVVEQQTSVHRPKNVRRKHWVGVSRKVKQTSSRASRLPASGFSGIPDLPDGFADQVLQSSGRVLSNDTQSFVYGDRVWVNTEAVSTDAEVAATMMRQVLVHPELRAKHGPKRVDQIIAKGIQDAGGIAYVNSLSQADDIAAAAPEVNRNGILLIDGAASGDNVLLDAVEAADRAILQYIKKTFPAVLPAFEVMSPASRIEVISGVTMMDNEALQFMRKYEPENELDLSDTVLTDTTTGIEIPTGKARGEDTKSFVSRTGILGTTESIASAADRIKALPKATPGIIDDISSFPGAFTRRIDAKLRKEGFSDRQLKNIGGLQKFNQYLKAVLKTPVREQKSFYTQAIKQIGHDMRELFVMEKRKQEKYKRAANRRGLETIGEDILESTEDPKLKQIARALLRSMHQRSTGASKSATEGVSNKDLVDNFNENYQDRLNVFSHQDRAENISSSEHKENFGEVDLDIQIAIRRIAVSNDVNEGKARKLLNDMMRMFHTPEYIISQLTTNPTWVDEIVTAMPKDMRAAYDAAASESKQQRFIRDLLFDYETPGSSNRINGPGSFTDDAGNTWDIGHLKSAELIDKINNYAPMGMTYDAATKAINTLYDHRRDESTGELINPDAWDPDYADQMQAAMATVNKKSEEIRKIADKYNLTENRTSRLAFNKFQFPVNKTMQELDTYSVNPAGTADGIFEDVAFDNNSKGMDPLEAQDKWAQAVLLQKNLQPMGEAILASALGAINNKAFDNISDNLYSEALGAEGSISLVEAGSAEHQAILRDMQKSAAQGYAGLDQMLVNLPFLESGRKRQVVHMRFQKIDGGSLVDKFVSDKKQKQNVTDLLNSKNPVIALPLRYGIFKSKQLTSWSPEHILRATFRDNAQVILSAMAEDGLTASGIASKAVKDIHTFENTKLVHDYVRLDEAVGRSDKGAAAEFKKFTDAHKDHKAISNLLKLRELGGIPEYNKQFTRNQDPGYLQQLAESTDNTGANADQLKALVDTLDSVARTADIMMRVSAFEASKVQGRSDQQAADFALGMAPFHRSGAHPYAPLLARSFMFFRSGVTGGIFNADQLLTAQYNTELAAGAFATAVALFPLLAAMAPDDDEGRNRFLTQGLADGNLSIWTPFSDRPANVPMPYIGSTGFFSTGINFMHAAAGHQSAPDALGASVRSFTQTFSPLNTAVPLFSEDGEFQPGVKALHLFTPEFLRPVMEQLTNTNGLGGTLSYGSGDLSGAFRVSQNNAGDWIDQVSRGLAAAGLPPDQDSLRHHIGQSLPLLDQAMDFAYGWGNLLTGNQYNDGEDILWPFAAFIGSNRDAELSSYYRNSESAKPLIERKRFLSKYMTDADIVASGHLTEREIAFADYWERSAGGARQRLGVAKGLRQDPTLGRNGPDGRVNSAYDEYEVAREYVLGTIMRSAREQFPDLMLN